MKKNGDYCRTVGIRVYGLGVPNYGKLSVVCNNTCSGRAIGDRSMPGYNLVFHCLAV